MPEATVLRVFVQRDYSEGTAVQFQKKFPLELEGIISRTVFEQTIDHINELFRCAENSDLAALLQGLCACLTGFLIYTCFDTQYEKYMKKLASYIQQQNDNLYGPKGLHLTSPMERGLRVIEITVMSTYNNK